MKIGINASFLRKPATGIGQVTLHFLNELFRLKRETRVLDGIEFILYLEKDIKIELPRNFYLNITKSVYRRDDLVRKIWWEKYILPKEVKKDKCDVFLSMYQSATIIKNGTRHVMIVHDIIPKIFSVYLGNFRKKLYQKLIDSAIVYSDEIISVSNNTKKDLKKYFDLNLKKISVSYISVDPIFEKKILKRKSEEVLRKYGLQNYIYIGGGLEVRKNVENSLRAYALLCKDKDLKSEMPDLLISGKFTQSLVPMITDVPSLIEELNIKEKVKFVGFVEQADLPILYKNAKCFLFPSSYEGFGMPVLEAMKEGVPVITSRNSSLAEVGGEVVLYTELNIESIAKSLKKILTDKIFADKLAKEGKERAKIFNWAKFSKDIISILKNE